MNHGIKGISSGIDAFDSLEKRSEIINGIDLLNSIDSVGS